MLQWRRIRVVGKQNNVNTTISSSGKSPLLVRLGPQNDLDTGDIHPGANTRLYSRQRKLGRSTIQPGRYLPRKALHSSGEQQMGLVWVWNSLEQWTSSSRWTQCTYWGTSLTREDCSYISSYVRPATHMSVFCLLCKSSMHQDPKSPIKRSDSCWWENSHLTLLLGGGSAR